MSLKNNFNIDKDKMYLTAGYMEAYIPCSLFENNLNTLEGKRATILGLFSFRIGSNEENIEKTKLHTFNITNMITTLPNEIEKKNLKLLNTSNQDYFVFKYYKGDVIVDNTIIICSSEAEEAIISSTLGGGLPPTIPYTELLNIYLFNFYVNGKIKVPAVVLSVFISNLYRYKNDLSVPFRKIFGKGKVDEFQYTALDARSVCANDSTFAALTFEDKDLMLASSVVRNRENIKENHSPVEKLLDCM